MEESFSPITLGRFYSQFQNQFQNIYRTINQSLREKIPANLRLASSSTTPSDGRPAQVYQEESQEALNWTLPTKGKSNQPKPFSFWPSFSLSYGVRKNSHGGNKKNIDKMIRPRPARTINQNPILTKSSKSQFSSVDSFFNDSQNEYSAKPEMESNEMELDDLDQTPYQKLAPSTTAKERLQSAKIRQLEKKIDWLISQQLSTIQHKDILSDLACTPINESKTIFSTSLHVANFNQEKEQSVSMESQDAGVSQNGGKAANIPPPPPPPPPPINFVPPKLPLSAAHESNQQDTPKISALKNTHTHSVTASSTPPQVMKSLLCEMKNVVLKPVVLGLLEDDFEGRDCKKGPRLNKAQRPNHLSNSSHLVQALKEKFVNAGVGERGDEDTEVESEWEKE